MINTIKFWFAVGLLFCFLPPFSRAHEVRHQHICDDSGKCKYVFEKEDISPESQYIEVHHYDDDDPPSSYAGGVPTGVDSVCESGSLVDYHHYYICE